MATTLPMAVSTPKAVLTVPVMVVSLVRPRPGDATLSDDLRLYLRREARLALRHQKFPPLPSRPPLPMTEEGLCPLSLLPTAGADQGIITDPPDTATPRVDVHSGVCEEQRLRRRVASLSQQLQDLRFQQHNIEELQSKVATLESDNSRLRSSLTTSESEISTLRGSLAASESENLSLRDSLVTIRTDVVNLQQRIDSSAGVVTRAATVADAISGKSPSFHKKRLYHLSMIDQGFAYSFCVWRT